MHRELKQSDPEARPFEKLRLANEAAVARKREARKRISAAHAKPAPKSTEKE